MSSPSLEPVREQYASLAAPVVVFNKSHSGSRLLAHLLAAGGVFMGAHQNDSADSLDIWALVDLLVRRYYPDYSALWDQARPADEELLQLVQQVFQRHLDGFDGSSGSPWGWKVCETAYVLPVIDYCFPNARLIHLIRDGRDVAFCDHKAPADAFWRKIYFNTDRIRVWNKLRLTPQSYRRRSWIYNALHWENSVTVGRNFGMMARERYLEVRYEDLCLDFENTARRIFAFVNVVDIHGALERMRGRVYTSSIAKYKAQPAARLKQVNGIIKPLLLALAYMQADQEETPLSVWNSHLADCAADRFRRRRAVES